MALWLPGQRVTADRLNMLTAQYARRSSDGVQTLAGGDQLTSFPTAVKTDPNVVAGGTGNQWWTCQPGAWLVETSVRISADQDATLFLTTGTTANESSSVAGADFSTFSCTTSRLMLLSVATTINLTTWRGGTAINIVSWGADFTHISFTRLPGY